MDNFGAMMCFGFKDATAGKVQSLINDYLILANYDRRLSVAYALGCITDTKARKE